jgi:2-phosphosulfolactate phosphatase
MEVLFTPAEFGALSQRDLSHTICVVFDVLRATSSMITALANGAEAIIPVAEISEALALRCQDSGILLAGERHGRLIQADLASGTRFNLGNSPREFTSQIVLGKRIAMTTTNGTRALRACARARKTLVACFLNLTATARVLQSENPTHTLLVCSGTFEEAAYEDVLAAGALCDLIWPPQADGVADSALIARRLYLAEKHDIPSAITRSRNGFRLASQPDLKDDVPFCARRDVIDFAVRMDSDGIVKRLAP